MRSPESCTEFFMFVPYFTVPLRETPRFKKLLALERGVKFFGRRREYLVRLLETGDDF